MREGLLKLLVCPACVQQFSLTSWRDTSETIVEGALTCPRCGERYAIIDGIPRILSRDLMGKLWHNHAGFFRRYREYFPTHPDDGSTAASVVERTYSSFSFQWNTFGEMCHLWETNFLDYVRPLEPEFFAGKLGLDAGCGFGRHVHYAAKYGAEMVGMDLSEAVEAAARINRDAPRVHLVQGDIYRPPFAPGTFDFCYSIGVLHHLPDPPAGFRSLARLVRVGGLMFIWVYGPRSGPFEVLTKVLRRWTPSMEHRQLYWLCWIMGGTLRVFSHVPYKVLARFDSLRPWADHLPFHGYHNFPFRALVGDIFDRFSVPLVRYYTAPALRGWFEEAGFEQIQAHRRFLHNESWRVFGLKGERV